MQEYHGTSIVASKIDIPNTNTLSPIVDSNEENEQLIPAVLPAIVSCVLSPPHLIGL